MANRVGIGIMRTAMMRNLARDGFEVWASTSPRGVGERAEILITALAGQGEILLDCSVSGTGAQAGRKDLVVFGSGDKAAFERVKEVLAGISRLQKYVGPFGHGSKMKLIANHLVTIHNSSMAEASS